MTSAEFKILFDEHFSELRRYIFYKGASEDEATDIAQAVFVKLWEKKPNTKPKEIIGLLYKMASDIFISKYRHDKVVANYAAKAPPPDTYQSPEDELEYKELNQKYETALKKLPDKQREVFLLSRMEELKYYEIAERLELSVKAVEKRMKNALQFLREAILVT